MTIFPMDAVDDVFDGERKFTVTHNMDGTQSFRDTTDYDQVGTEFGALEYNALLLWALQPAQRNFLMTAG